jgi:predicted dehydrogenase
MAGKGPLGVAIVGCGNISNGYASTMQAHADRIRLVGSFDIDRSRAEALAQRYGGRVYESLDAVLADPAVEVVVNLTIHQAHVEVITKCLNGGRHVHTEKPLAMDPAEAQQLVRLAQQRGLRLSSAPITFMGEAQQTAWKAIRDGRLGAVRMVYAEMNWGRIESWHPNPSPFYEVGALYDVGVYPLTVLTTILGPVQQVRGFGKVLAPQRQTKDGTGFEVRTPDWMCGLLEFESGAACRITTSFWVGPTMQHGIEFHGDAATLYLGAAQDFKAKVQLRPFGQRDWEDLPMVKEPFAGVDWARGLTELHEAIRNNRPQRATGEQAAHVVEVIAGVHRSAETNQPVAIASRFTPPAPMDWAR